MPPEQSERLMESSSSIIEQPRTEPDNETPVQTTAVQQLEMTDSIGDLRSDESILWYPIPVHHQHHRNSFRKCHQ
uniref:Uncharacterized protein n=1 Tax=Heliothis virescens TaxID=7102 RepID=A0A2A4IXY4_HELVI